MSMYDEVEILRREFCFRLRTPEQKDAFIASLISNDNLDAKGLQRAVDLAKAKDAQQKEIALKMRKENEEATAQANDPITRFRTLFNRQNPQRLYDWLNGQNVETVLKLRDELKSHPTRYNPSFQSELSRAIAILDGELTKKGRQDATVKPYKPTYAT